MAKNNETTTIENQIEQLLGDDFNNNVHMFI